MDAELISAVVVVVLAAVVVWRSGASWRQATLMVLVLALGIVVTALIGNWLANTD